MSSRSIVGLAGAPPYLRTRIRRFEGLYHWRRRHMAPLVALLHFMAHGFAGASRQRAETRGIGRATQMRHQATALPQS